jgi:hypothetical protein
MLRHSYGLAKATAPDDDDDSGHRSSKAHMFLMKRRWKETDTRTTNCVKKRSDKRRRKNTTREKTKPRSRQTNKFSPSQFTLTERIRSWRCGRASRKRQRDRSELFTTTTRWLHPHIFSTTPRGDMQIT